MTTVATTQKSKKPAPSFRILLNPKGNDQFIVLRQSNFNEDNDSVLKATKYFSEIT